MKKIIIVFFLMVSSVCFAQIRNPKLVRTEDIAAGYTDISKNGPANASLDDLKSGFTAISLDVYGSVSNILSMYGWLKDVVDYKDSFDSILDIGLKYNGLVGLMDRAHWNIFTTLQLDLLGFEIRGKKLGYLYVGMYLDSFGTAKVNAPDVHNISISDDHIVIGQRTNLLRARGMGSSGIKLLYGRVIGLPHNMSLGIGIGNKFFYRLLIPLHTVSLNENIQTDEDINIPDFHYDKGFGFSVDLFSTLDINDPYLDEN